MISEEIYRAKGKRDYISDSLNNERKTGVCLCVYVHHADDLVNQFGVANNI